LNVFKNWKNVVNYNEPKIRIKVDKNKKTKKNKWENVLIYVREQEDARV
jgi:hypothetical protein